MKRFYKTVLCPASFCFLTLDFYYSSAQTNVYHPFPDSNAVWISLSANMSEPQCPDHSLSRYELKGDTLINGKNYNKLYGMGCTYKCNIWSEFCLTPDAGCSYLLCSSSPAYAGALKQD